MDSLVPEMLDTCMLASADGLTCRSLRNEKDHTGSLLCSIAISVSPKCQARVAWVIWWVQVQHMWACVLVLPRSLWPCGACWACVQSPHLHVSLAATISNLKIALPVLNMTITGILHFLHAPRRSWTSLAFAHACMVVISSSLRESSAGDWLIMNRLARS